jgi:putative transposase
MLDQKVEGFGERIGVEAACQAFGVNPRTFRHRRQIREGRLPMGKARPKRARTAHPAALTSQERLQILETLCSERFCDLSPAQVFNALLDQGTYLCSLRQMYRLLEDHGLVRERRRGGHARRGEYPIPQIEAAAPNQC